VSPINTRGREGVNPSVKNTAKLGYNEHSVITNKILVQNAMANWLFTTQIDQVIPNGFGLSRAIRYNRL